MKRIGDRSYNCLCCIFLLVIITNHGCAPYYRINDMKAIDRSFNIDTSFKIEEDKLIYSRQRRCYTYNDRILLKETGEKISNRKEAAERLRYQPISENFSIEKVISYPVFFVWFAVIGVPLFTADHIAGIPASPYIFYLDDAYRKESFENYKRGEILLSEGNYNEARKYFFKAREIACSLVQQSDLLFKIAETYQTENIELAHDYYLMFLSYSQNLYPVYFSELDSNYINDLNVLDKEFGRAENILNIRRNKGGNGDEEGNQACR